MHIYIEIVIFIVESLFVFLAAIFVLFLLLNSEHKILFHFFLLIVTKKTILISVEAKDILFH